MPCLICKACDHTLKECNDASIGNTIDEIKSICMRMIALQEEPGNVDNTTILIAELTTYVEKLPNPMLKSIIYNTRFFQYIPTGGLLIFDRNTDYGERIGYTDVTGAKPELMGKVLYLFLSNARREYPIEFFKKDHHVRRLWFKHEVYWHTLSKKLTKEVAIHNQLKYPRLIEECYMNWLNALKTDAENLLHRACDKFTMRSNRYSGYSLQIKGAKEVEFHARHNDYRYEVLKGVQYSEREGFYIKKHIMEHLISLYNGSIEYSYTDVDRIQLVVHNVPEHAPEQQLKLYAPRPRPAPAPAPQPAPQPAPILNQILAEIVYMRYQELVQQRQQQPLVAPRPALRKFNIQIESTKKVAGAECTSFDCPICMDTKTETKKERPAKMVMNCGHEFCGSCTTQYLNDYRSKTSDPVCPLCRGVIKKIGISNSRCKMNKEFVVNLRDICT